MIELFIVIMDEKQVRKIVKEELKPIREELDVVHEKIDFIDERQSRMEKEQTEIKERQEEMMKSIDFLVGWAQDQKQEETAGNYLEKLQDEKLNDHEKRITNLEAVSA